MDKLKIVLLLISSLILVSSASALLYQVDVDASLNHSSFDLDYRNKTDTLQVVSSSVTNTGSVGCTYRLRADISRNSTEASHYSRGYELWPGETAAMNLRFISGNTTGQIQTQIYLEYCGENENIGDFTFNDTQSEQLNSTVDSRTTEATATGAEAKLPVRQGILVPVETPSYWKVSSAEINDSKASLDYEPTLFRSQEKIVFAVLNKSNEDVIGSTNVDLETSKPVFDVILDNLEYILLVASLFVNIALGFILFRARRK